MARNDKRNSTDIPRHSSCISRDPSDISRNLSQFLLVIFNRDYKNLYKRNAVAYMIKKRLKQIIKSWKNTKKRKTPIFEFVSIRFQDRVLRRFQQCSFWLWRCDYGWPKNETKKHRLRLDWKPKFCSVRCNIICGEYNKWQLGGLKFRTQKRSSEWANFHPA